MVGLAFGDTGSATLYERDGTVIVSSDPARRGHSVSVASMRALVSSATGGTLGYRSVLLARDEFVAVAPLPGLPASFAISQAQDEIFAPAKVFARGVIGALAVLVAFAALIATLAARSRFAYERALRTSRHRIAAQARSMAEALELRDAILASANNAIITVDPDGIIRSVNPAAIAWLGYARDEMVGRMTPFDLHDPEDLARRREDTAKAVGKSGADLVYTDFVAKARDGGVYEGERIFRRKDGTTFPVFLSVTALHDADRRVIGYLGIATDISERKRMERLKNEFVSTVSHELRTPLTSIRGSLGLLAGGVVGTMPAQAEQLVKIAHTNSERLVRLINDILDIERIEAGKMDFRFEVLDLSHAVENAVLANRAYAEHYGAVLAFRDRPRGIKVRADRDRLMQVLANLMSNAAKYAPGGSRIDVGVRVDGGTARITITDHGPGVPPEFRDRIFSKFAQADSSDTRQKGGSGLGLSITKAIVEGLGGRIGFDSVPGETTFWIELPTLGATSEGVGAPRVLIVEPDPEAAAALASMIREAGCHAELARDVATAQRLLDAQRFAAITVEVALPDGDGLSFLRELRERATTRALPAIVVSVQPNDRARSLDGGFLPVLDWLEKPVDRERLIEGVRSAVKPRGVARVLHVEDDADLAVTIAHMLAPDIEVVNATSLAQARELLATQDFGLVLLDVALPDGSGLDLLPDAQRRDAALPVVIFSAHDVGTDVAARVARVLGKAQVDNERFVAVVRSLIVDGKGQHGD